MTNDRLKIPDKFLSRFWGNLSAIVEHTLRSGFTVWGRGGGARKKETKISGNVSMIYVGTDHVDFMSP